MILKNFSSLQFQDFFSHMTIFHLNPDLVVSMAPDNWLFYFVGVQYKTDGGTFDFDDDDIEIPRVRRNFFLFQITFDDL